MSRLPLIDKIWALGLTALLMLGQKYWGDQNKIGQSIFKRIRIYEFDPITLRIDTGNFSKMIEFYDALEEGSLQPTETSV